LAMGTLPSWWPRYNKRHSWMGGTGAISGRADEAIRGSIMRCRQARARISAYMDHELDAASSRQLESHLHRCPECREALNDFQGLDDIVRGLPRIQPGPDFARQIVMKASKNTGTAAGNGQGRLSLFDRLPRLVEDFVDLMCRARTRSTGTLDEFGDFPPLFHGLYLLQADGISDSVIRCIDESLRLQVCSPIHQISLWEEVSSSWKRVRRWLGIKLSGMLGW
jgi:hypothetical protein